MRKKIKKMTAQKIQSSFYCSRASLPEERKEKSAHILQNNIDTWWPADEKIALYFLETSEECSKFYAHTCFKITHRGTS
jgi:hypothetical protein